MQSHLGSCCMPKAHLMPCMHVATVLSAFTSRQLLRLARQQAHPCTAGGLVVVSSLHLFLCFVSSGCMPEVHFCAAQGCVEWLVRHITFM
jgi:hypothetical protein